MKFNIWYYELHVSDGLTLRWLFQVPNLGLSLKIWFSEFRAKFGPIDVILGAGV